MPRGNAFLLVSVELPQSTEGFKVPGEPDVTHNGTTAFWEMSLELSSSSRSMAPTVGAISWGLTLCSFEEELPRPTLEDCPLRPMRTG